MSKKLSANQKLFNLSVRKLLKQGCKSQNPKTGQCLYRGPNGTRCAIGHAIPNRLYQKEMDRTTQGGMNCGKVTIVGQTLDQLGYPNENFNLALQDVHDNNPVETWPLKFKALASEYGLKLPKELQGA